MSLLGTIIDTKKQEILSLPDVMPIPSSRPSFIDAVLQHTPALIAEIKPKSPSEGHLLSREEVPTLVDLYSKHAQAISVLCDRTFFGGGYDLLQEVRSLTDTPLLAKEFIIDAKQIRYAAHCGADAVLLIAAQLTSEQLVAFSSLAVELGLSVLVEVHTEAEIRKLADTYRGLSSAVQQQILVGINNRNLDTLRVDLSVTEQLAPIIRTLMPSMRGVLSESGIHTREDVVGLQSHVQGFLIGTSILQAKNRASYLTSLFPS